MNQALVSLDLETTGLNPETDQIIEIGAVKFRGKEVLDTLHSLVNPHCALPYRICWLTGITSEELKTAPSFAAVAPELLSFVDSHPIVGQNISFDLNFLSSQGIKLSAPAYDILEIANILLPQLPNHSLPAVAEELQISPSAHHRALADAMTAKEVFLALLDKASHLTLPLITEILRLTAATQWVWRPFFLDIEKAKRAQISSEEREAFGIDFAPKVKDSETEPLVPHPKLQPLDSNWLSSLLNQDGPMAKAFPSYEYRPEQVSMMQAIAEALNTSQHLISEAGTGVGKSIAYLLPAIFFALENNAPIILSTNTINLQEQLVSKDIPDLLRALDVPQSLRVAQLKGRSNYLCLRRWNSWHETPGLSKEEVRFLLRTLVWLSSTSTGDCAELNLKREEVSFWSRVCASEGNCLEEQCPYREGRCFLYRARQRAEASHLVVVNHALLLSDLVNSKKVLPNYSHLVLDEAHHLEEEATEQLGYQVGQWDIFDYLDRFGERGGTLFHLQNWLQNSSIGLRRRRELEQGIEGLRGQVRAAHLQVSQFFDHLSSFLYGHTKGQGEYERHLRLTGEIRRHSDWTKVELSWESLSLQLGGIEASLSELYAMLESLGGGEASGLKPELLALYQEGGRLRRQVNSVVAGPEADYIYWASLREQQNTFLHAAPLHLGQALEKMLFSPKKCVVLTSATLTTAGSFEYIKECLGLREAAELVVASPFDYQKSTLVYLPQGIPEPKKPDHQQLVEQAVIELCRATQGHTLVLFTSHTMLRATRAAVRAPLEEEGILVLGQGIDGSPKQLVNIFRANPRTILLGAASLWEGIDVMGKALSVVIIVRLPFSVPTDPIFSARCELFEDSFNQYALPQAVLKFKQGFGRLIRSRQDRGAVVILDSRLQTRSYGKVFLESLPPCTVKRGSLRQMPQEIAGWLRSKR